MVSPFFPWMRNILSSGVAEIFWIDIVLLTSMREKVCIPVSLYFTMTSPSAYCCAKVKEKRSSVDSPHMVISCLNDMIQVVK